MKRRLKPNRRRSKNTSDEWKIAVYDPSQGRDIPGDNCYVALSDKKDSALAQVTIRKKANGVSL
jgi:hypothetical protein